MLTAMAHDTLVCYLLLLAPTTKTTALCTSNKTNHKLLHGVQSFTYFVTFSN